MTNVEHLLVCLMEEAAEVQKACAKALRFGLDDTYRRDHESLPANTPQWTMTPREEIEHELNDMAAVIPLLHDRGILPKDPDPVKINLKREKVRRLMEYARSQGTLAEDTSHA